MQEPYFAMKCWNREDIADRLIEIGYHGTKWEIDKVLKEKILKHLEECTYEDWNTIVNAIEEAGFPLNELDSVLGVGDVIVLTIPLTDETKGMMNSERFGKMKNGTVLVNIARGTVVKTDALINALEENLRGAVLDVFEEEPLGLDSPLWNMENVIVTPHNSFIGDGNRERMLNVIYRNLEEMA